MSTRQEIKDAIQENLKDHLHGPITVEQKMDLLVTRIAAGIRMPDKTLSPPLPDLSSSGTVDTATTAAYKALPSTYQRNVFMVADSNEAMISPPVQGDYYNYQAFLDQAAKKDLSSAGSIIVACVLGSNLYYQPIRATSEELTVYFYRKPVDMAKKSTEPDGIPLPFQMDLLFNGICADVFGSKIGNEVKPDVRFPDMAFSKHRWHIAEFYRAMDEMIGFIPPADGVLPYFQPGID